MENSNWRYYKHAAIPTTAPHDSPDLSPIFNRSIWQIDGGKPLLARWTDDFDCGHETNWWYVIKDDPFDIESLKSKRRYEINKGKSNFKVERINPNQETESIYRTTVAAYSGWPQKYRPSVTMEQMEDIIKSWDNYCVFGAYSKTDGVLQGYAVVQDYQSYAAFSILRTNPECEKSGINAAIVEGVLSEFNSRFGDGFYICDGERSIRHETAFQDYLEKYFGFRKAYCHLNVKYRPGIKWIVKLLYPFRKIISSNTRIGSQICGVLRMEEIVGENKKSERKNEHLVD